MKTWLYNRGDENTLTPADPVNPIRHGRQTGEGRHSDEAARDMHPSATDAQLDAMESGGRKVPAVPHALMSTAPAGSHKDTPRPSLEGSEEHAERLSAERNSEERKQRRSKSGTVRGGLSHLAHATAEAMERFMLGDSDEDTMIPRIPKTDRYGPVKDRQVEFMRNANEIADSDRLQSPFERYRTRMGEVTGNVANAPISESPSTSPSPSMNRIASVAPNRSVDAQTKRRLIISDQPLRIAPAESKPSMEQMANRSDSNGAQSISNAPRGSLEVTNSPAMRVQLGRSPAVTAPLHERQGIAERGPSTGTSLRSIEEGRTTQNVTRVQNVRVVKPRYLIPREFVYGFGAATVMGLCIGCVTLAIGIRNANYLRGPHASSLLPDVQAQLNNVTEIVSALAAMQGINVGMMGHGP